MSTSVETTRGEVVDDIIVDLVEDADKVFAQQSARYLERQGYSSQRIVEVLVQELDLPLQVASDLAKRETTAR